MAWYLSAFHVMDQSFTFCRQVNPALQAAWLRSGADSQGYGLHKAELRMHWKTGDKHRALEGVSLP